MRGKGKVLGVVITLVSLVLAFYRVDYEGLFAALSRANYALLVPALVLWLVGYLMRTVRWRVILAGSGPGSTFDLFGVLMVGFATNNLLPARLGEVARAHLMRQRTGMRRTFVLASIFLERLFDGLALVGAAAGVAILLYRHELAARLVGLAARPLPRRFAHFATSAFGSFVEGLSSMRRGDVVVSTILLSIVVWTIEWAAYYAVASAFDLGLSNLELAAACAFLLVVVNLGIMLPAAPGYVGTFQLFAVASLGVWGIPKEPALAVAIVAHLAQFILVTAIGLAFFGREQVSLRSMSMASADLATSDGEAALTEVRR
jgi:uncharacterized membrane protein YbhN (UPF0104 family)